MPRNTLPLLVCCSAITLGCVYPKFKNVGEEAGSGGTTDEGGTTNRGGTSNSGAGNTGKGGATSTDASASGGRAPSTGATASGGATVSGATTATGGTSGATATAGTTNVGGTATTGGTSSVGGTSARGGSSASGGTSSIGGTSAKGGSSASGGTTTTGGTSSIGGTTAKGGSSASGGTSVALPPSCQVQGITPLTCQAESCCKSLSVPGNTGTADAPFKMGRSEVNSAGNDYYAGAATDDDRSDELPEHDARVATFALDKYEVTVGRFRNFVAAYNGWRSTPSQVPAAKAGENPNVPNTGWNTTWNAASYLPANADGLKAVLTGCDVQYRTWSESGTANDNFPVNCVSWYMAFAFCIWDGGRLPTEAEWEYAAAGGTLNRLYPWGTDAPGSRANYQGYKNSPLVAVGSEGTPDAGSYGHQDLSGSMWEWAFDWYLADYYGSASPVACNNCANTTVPSASSISASRTIRGGGWDYAAGDIRAAVRDYRTPDFANYGVGFRCARTP